MDGFLHHNLLDVGTVPHIKVLSYLVRMHGVISEAHLSPWVNSDRAFLAYHVASQNSVCVDQRVLHASQTPRLQRYCRIDTNTQHAHICTYTHIHLLLDTTCAHACSHMFDQINTCVEVSHAHISDK